MADFLLILLAGIVLVVVAGSGALMLTYFAYAGGQMLTDLADNLSSRVGAAFGSLATFAGTKARQKQIQGNVMSTINPQGGIDPRFVRSVEATRCINAALKATKTAMETCCDIHKFTAHATGCQDMIDLQFDPTCIDLRQRVIDTIDVTTDMIQGYPSLLPDKRLIKQAIALRSLRTICEDCELLHYPVAKVPPLCTPAASM